MANTKISGLSSASTPLTGSEIVPLNQSGVTDSVSVANLTANRAVSAASLTLSTGNVTQGASGTGYNFTANTPAAGMTSQLLNWYEEGTWTPTLAPVSGTIVSSTITGTYTRSGNLVFVAIRVLITNNGTGSVGLNITGFPFAAKTATTISGATREDTSVGFAIVASPTSKTSIFLSKYDGSYPGGNNYGFSLCLTYNI